MADPYHDPDSQPETALQAMMTRLEERGRHAAFAGMIRQYASTLPRDRPLTVLDLGCGTGVVVRQLMDRVHPDSVLHGADISAELLGEAARLAPSGRITWDHVSPGPLPYADETFDVVTMHTLLSHVPDPLAVLGEASFYLSLYTVLAAGRGRAGKPASHCVRGDPHRRRSRSSRMRFRWDPGFGPVPLRGRRGS